MAGRIKFISATYSTDELLTIAGFYALCVTLFLMPFSRSWSLYPLGIFLSFGLFMWFTQPSLTWALFRKHFTAILPVMAYFIIHFFYFLFNCRWVFLEDKLMFILLPLLGIPIFGSDYFRNHLRIILLSFISGIVSICVYQLVRSTVESLSVIDGIIRFEPFISPHISRYNWVQLSPVEHPTYLALKTLWAIILLLLVSLRDFFIWKYKLFIILLLSVFIFLLSSRSGIGLLVFILIWYVFTLVKSSRIRIAFIFLIPFLLYFSFKLATLSSRVNEQFSFVSEKFTAAKFDWKNLDHRTRSWYSSLVLIKDKPFLGVGLDARNILSEEYRRQGYNTEADFRLNAHNQFLETQLTLGIPGSIVLFWMLITPVLKRKKIWAPQLVYPFVIIVAVSMIFESILVRQWGIMFFVIFYCILVLPDEKVMPN